MIGDADADGAALRVLELPRHFTRRRQKKRIAPGNTLLHDAKLPVVENSVASDFGEIATHDGQIMLVVDASQRANALRGRGVAHLAPERVARIGRVRDYASRADDASRAPHQPRLRIDRMDRKIL